MSDVATVCVVCEEPTNEDGAIRCRGFCQETFHISCLDNLDEAEKPENGMWKCKECNLDWKNCMICNSTEGGNTISCQFKSCGRRYHESCLKSGLWPQAKFVSSQLLACPAHVCHTCSVDRMPSKFATLRTCVRCPTSYHVDDLCLPAGCDDVSDNRMFCPKHYKPPKRKANSSHVNSSWCFTCTSGGTLICCEICPASFHAECLKIEPPEGAFYCTNCEQGRRPLCGEILWVKQGKYRWWPAQVLHPQEIPDKLNRVASSVGEFGIQFCGSSDYAWMTIGRSYPYQEGDSEGNKSLDHNHFSSLDSSYQAALEDAKNRFAAYTEARSKREDEIESRSINDSKPEPYIRLKTNKPFGDCPVYDPDLADEQPCNCDPNSSDPCGKNTNCFNRHLMYECIPSTCRAKEKCGNMRFQRQLYPKMAIRHTRQRGWGLFLEESVKKGDFVIEYVGELISTAEYKKRQREKSENYYYMFMDANRVIDAGPKGNEARFMNHSCDPNCETEKWVVNGDYRIGLFARMDIPAGTELTFNYEFEAVGDLKAVCLCKSKNCLGFIGAKQVKEKTDKPSATAPQNSTKKAKHSKTKIPKKQRENLCFRCLQDGELLMCDHKNCPKVYHLDCVDQEKKPCEKWTCPWHFCDTCGKSAARMCSLCPNSFCDKHDVKMKLHENLGLICDEHRDVLGDELKFFDKLKDKVMTDGDPKTFNQSASEVDEVNDKSPIVKHRVSPPGKENYPVDNRSVTDSKSSPKSSPSLSRNEILSTLLVKSGEKLFKGNPLVVKDGVVVLSSEKRRKLVRNDHKKSEVGDESLCRKRGSKHDTPDSSACIPCPVPDCSMNFHKSNTARHFRYRHAELDYRDYQRPKIIIKESKSSSKQSKVSKPGFKSPTCTKSPLLISIFHSPGSKLKCGFTACVFSTRSQSVLENHRRQWSHFINIKFAKADQSVEASNNSGSDETPTEMSSEPNAKDLKTGSSQKPNSHVVRGRWSCPNEGCGYVTKVFLNYTYHKNKAHPENHFVFDRNQVEEINTDSEKLTKIKAFGHAADAVTPGEAFTSKPDDDEGNTKKSGGFNTLIPMGLIADYPVDHINRPMEVDEIDVEENRVINLILSEVEETREDLINLLSPTIDEGLCQVGKKEDASALQSPPADSDVSQSVKSTGKSQLCHHDNPYDDYEGIELMNPNVFSYQVHVKDEAYDTFEETTSKCSM